MKAKQMFKTKAKKARVGAVGNQKKSAMGGKKGDKGKKSAC